ncbi:hypothetical protein AB4090_14330 [Acidithiobacillus sp. IBUN Pt1247-S3]|uniref:hypothetical protein n=1 Tax=Acidithiobacillus sp. IBUN Pt1247-S3 TaxID=3166642 RepID=UPI0034E3961D
MLPRELLYRNSALLALRNELGDQNTQVWYSNLADNALGLQEPLSGVVLLSPELEKQPVTQRRAILARELGKASVPGRRRAWWMTAAALLLCVVFDIVLIRVNLFPNLRLVDAVLATLCFWVAIWQFRSLHTVAARQRREQHIQQWARTRVPDYDSELAQAIASTPIPPKPYRRS